MKTTIDPTPQETSDYASQSTATKPPPEQPSAESNDAGSHDQMPLPSNPLDTFQPVYLHGQTHIICSNKVQPMPESSLCLLSPTVMGPKLPHMTMQPTYRMFVAQFGPDPGGGTSKDLVVFC